MKFILLLLVSLNISLISGLVADGGLCSFYDRTPYGHTCVGQIEFWNRHGLVRQVFPNLIPYLRTLVLFIGLVDGKKQNTNHQMAAKCFCCCFNLKRRGQAILFFFFQLKRQQKMFPDIQCLVLGFQSLVNLMKRTHVSFDYSDVCNGQIRVFSVPYENAAFFQCLLLNYNLRIA